MQETDKPLREQVEAALRRAAQKARELSERTNTPFISWRDGQVIDLNATATATDPLTVLPAVTPKT